MFGKLKWSRNVQWAIAFLVSLMVGAFVGVMKPSILSYFLTKANAASEKTGQLMGAFQKRGTRGVQSVSKLPTGSLSQSNMKGNFTSLNKELQPFVGMYDSNLLLDALESYMKGHLSVGHTVKDQPIVRIYDYVPIKESVEERQRRFNRIKAWLCGVSDRNPDSTHKCTTPTKRILWLDVNNGAHSGRESGRMVDFSKCACRCEVDYFIFNESDAQSVYDPFGADAVLLQINKLELLAHPPLKREGQVFVAVEREVSATDRLLLHNWEYIFNWTMSFRTDSDIFYPYGRIKKRTEESSLAKNYTDIFKQKKYGIIWFVSNCNTSSKREDFAKELSKYIDIDVVGKCWKELCPKNSVECLKEFEEQYFFRIDFEDAYHTDYVTEKVFENFSSDIIQIIGGGADYEDIVPNKTVIDVNNFRSPKDLAIYLKSLMRSEERYTQYLRTKDKYYAQGLEDESQRAYCELCSMLHDPQRYKNLYFSVGDWFHDNLKMTKTAFPQST